MKILAISGSLRAASHNTALLRAAADLAPEGVEVELYQGLELLPPFNEDWERDPPSEAIRLREAIDDADTVLFSTPEYNGTMPGQMKNVVDWGSRPHGPGAALWGKPVAAIGASVTDYGAIWAQDHLRRSLGLAGARVLDADFPVAAASKRFDPAGRLTDLETRDRLATLLQSLVHDHSQLATAA